MPSALPLRKPAGEVVVAEAVGQALLSLTTSGAALAGPVRYARASQKQRFECMACLQSGSHEAGNITQML
jgi:hypothetical protein